MAIWVTADLHLQHKNIINYCRSQFKTVEEHDNFVIEEFNKIVGKDDLVYILGDLGFTPKDKLISQIRRLNGRKILVVGNHDRMKDNDYITAGIIQVIRHPIYYNNNIILSHLPIQECYNNPWVINVHGHLHNSNLNLPNYFNANIELTDFKPVNINIYVDKAKEICQEFRWQPYGSEWYHKWEIKK